MPTYDYICNDCLKDKFNGELTDEAAIELSYEARHSMDAIGEELLESIKCPICNGFNVFKIFSSDVHVRIKGKDWKEFKKRNYDAIKRDMHLHALQNNDPYASMRQDGEVDHIADNLKSGKKPERKYFHS